MSADRRRQPGEPPEARSLMWFVCHHGTLHIELVDRDGKIFATAALPCSEAWRLVDDVRDALPAGIVANRH